MTAGTNRDLDPWQRFVISHGRGAHTADLAFILRQPEPAIRRLRATGACATSAGPVRFTDLFRLWHGREPREEEWPTPRLVRRGEYEWQAPELALLASLVGRLGKPEIAKVLTERLRQVTGDLKAGREVGAVQNAIARIGMQSKDVVGGVTIADAARETGSLAMVQQAVRNGHLRAFRVGRNWVIPHEAWTVWKARRVFPPAGYVPLASLKQTLAIRSDKLSEYARLGYIPSAVRCNPYGTGRKSTQFGTWWIDPAVADRLLADRHAGRQMPWHGKPLADNLRATYRLWQQRQHPPSCSTCEAIWGPTGAPATFESYSERYPPLAYGAKRHLTLPWRPGLTKADLARKAGCSVAHVGRAIANGTLPADVAGRNPTITKTDATRWISRRCPAGDTQKSWVSLETAEKRYQFTALVLRRFIASGALASRTGTDGAMRGVIYVSKTQCAKLREEIGFSETEAARRAGVTVPELRRALDGVNWRGTGAIPLVTVQAVIKRLQSKPGITIEEAARSVGRTVAWVEARIADGTIRPLRTRGDAARLYLSEPMLRRLRAAAAATATPPSAALGEGWLRLGAAALEAGVTAATIIKWAEQGEVRRVRHRTGWRYEVFALRKRARAYWRTVRFHRAQPPAWLHTDAVS